MKAKWSEPRHACTRITIGPFTAYAEWSDDRTRPGYVARFENERPADRYPDIDAAKSAALELARKTLTDALAALPPTPTPADAAAAGTR